MRTLRTRWLFPLLLSLLLLAGGCTREQPFRQPQADFFPLAAHSTWTYRVDDKSQLRPFMIMDTVVGRRYIPALNLTGTLVEEYCTLERADRDTPLVFFPQNGYIVKVSALVHSQNQITAGPFGAVNDDRFLPARLLDQQSWNDQLWPLGRLALQLKLQIDAHTRGETADIVVPAGRFHQCIRIESHVSYNGPYDGPKPDLTYVDWYAPRVGLVQSIVHSGNSDGIVISHRVLQAYQINQ
jgi:hypothetical protein